MINAAIAFIGIRHMQYSNPNFGRQLLNDVADILAPERLHGW